MSARPTADAQPRIYEVAIVGNDALLAALPARPVQLAHAILACGFDLVVPVSWGEEAIAVHALRVLSTRGDAPVVFCACPSVRNRLVAVGSELVDHLVSCVAPAVATARYLRALDPAAAMHITFIGSCEGARDESIDARVLPAGLLRHLASHGISLDRQPVVFDSVVPLDRRRHFSLPGGCPSADALRTRDPARDLTTLPEGDLATELAELLLVRERRLIDLTTILGCACCGGPMRIGGLAQRDEITALEPPRSLTPIIDHSVSIDLSAPIGSVLFGGWTERSQDERVTLPVPEGATVEGVHPIERARQRTEQRFIAVTPPSAMVVRRSLGGPRPEGEGEPRHHYVTEPATLSERRAAPPPAPSPPRTPADASALLLGLTTEAGRHEGPPPAAPTAWPAQAASPPPRDTPMAPAATPPAEPAHPAARRRTPVNESFVLARSAVHPRAQSGGRVLPRAYARLRTPPSGVMRFVEASPARSADVERAVPIMIEPQHTELRSEVRPATDIPEPGGVREFGRKPSARRRPEAVVQTPPPAPGEDDPLVSRVYDSARVHVRHVRAREVPAPHPRRSVGVVIAVVASVLALAAIVVASYVTLRR